MALGQTENPSTRPSPIEIVALAPLWPVATAPSRSVPAETPLRRKYPMLVFVSCTEAGVPLAPVECVSVTASDAMECGVKSVLPYQLAGAALLGFCGSQLANSLNMTMQTEAALAGFAVAILLFAAAPVRSLRHRVLRLEETVSQMNPSSSPPAV